MRFPDRFARLSRKRKRWKASFTAHEPSKGQWRHVMVQVSTRQEHLQTRKETNSTVDGDAKM